MAGAFTHMALCRTAMYDPRLDADLGFDLQGASQYAWLGAVSPDLPYLSWEPSTVNWADTFHYKSTNAVVLHCLEKLRETWQEKNDATQAKAAWVLGYVSHLVADATIHPIVQAIVGPYEIPANRTPHRICEMTQDVLIYDAEINAELAYGELSSYLRTCQESEAHVELMDFWAKGILASYPELGEPPDPGTWFKEYVDTIDISEGGSAVAAIFRHAGKGFVYQTVEDIRKNEVEYQRFYSMVKLPAEKTGSFRHDGFVYARNNIVQVWNAAYAFLKGEGISLGNVIRNCNLDTGIDMDNENLPPLYWR